MSLPQPIINTLIARMYPPTGIWKDYQYDFDFYQFLKTLVSIGRINASDLPEEPDPDDYPDTNSEATRA